MCEREVSPPRSSAKSQCGGPPTASIPKTHDQPEEANSERFRPCGNNASTGISRVPLTRQLMQRPMSGSQRTSHLDAGTTTSSACTKNPNGVRAGRPRPADNTPQSSDRGARNMRLHSTRRWQDMQNRQHTAESGSFRSRRRSRHAAVRSLARCARSGPVLAPSARSWTRELEGIVLPRAAGRGGWPARSRSRGAQRGVRASEARGCIVPR
jgi:hypothetical protein